MLLPWSLFTTKSRITLIIRISIRGRYQAVLRVVRGVLYRERDSVEIVHGLYLRRGIFRRFIAVVIQLETAREYLGPQPDQFTALRFVDTPARIPCPCSFPKWVLFLLMQEIYKYFIRQTNNCFLDLNALRLFNCENKKKRKKGKKEERENRKRSIGVRLISLFFFFL